MMAFYCGMSPFMAPKQTFRGSAKGAKRLLPSSGGDSDCVPGSLFVP